MISLFFMYPYLFSNTLNLEHDTFFHLSRIEGLAQSIKNGTLLPPIYPYKNGGFGYGSPLFYSDFFLTIPALLYLLGISISSSYKVLIFLASFFSALSMAFTTKTICQNKYAPYLGAMLYLFSNYRITDVYVRGAAGEVVAFIFLPLILLAVFYLLKKENKKSIFFLVIAFSGLILSHNITFILGCILLAFLLLCNLKNILNKESIKSICLAVILVFCLTAFFTFGMLEQMLDHTMIVHYYGSSSDLSSTALCAWQFFINQTIFGLAGNSGDPSSIMVTNPGWFLTFVPMTQFLIIEKDNTLEESLIHQCTLLGFFFLFFSSGFIPWNALSFLNIIQFPWRLMTLACTLLCVPASIVLFKLIRHYKVIFVVSFVFITINSIWLLQPVLDRTFVITHQTKYSEILDGTLIDPYYSATYMRVELAGGDYLPWPSIDYRYTPYAIQTLDNQIIQDHLIHESLTLQFDLTQPHESLIAPLTWYKGYTAYWLDGQNHWIQLPTHIHETSGLVQFSPEYKTGTFKITYEKTPVQWVGIGLSFITLTSLLILVMIKKKEKAIL